MKKVAQPPRVLVKTLAAHPEAVSTAWITATVMILLYWLIMG